MTPFTPPVLPNARLLRDVGTQLMEPALADPLAGQDTPSRGRGDRLQGAVASIASVLDPNSTYGPEAFLGAATRGFAGVRTYLQGLAQQRVEAQEEGTTRRLERDRIRAGTAAEQARARSEDAQAARAAQPPAPVVPEWQKQGYPSFEAWRQDENRPRSTPPRSRAPELRVGEDGFQYERGADNRWKKSVDAEGRPFRPRPTGARGGVTPRGGTTPPTPPAKVLSQEDYNLLKADGMTDQEMRDSGYTLP